MEVCENGHTSQNALLKTNLCDLLPFNLLAEREE